MKFLLWLSFKTFPWRWADTTAVTHTAPHDHHSHWTFRVYLSFILPTGTLLRYLHGWEFLWKAVSLLLSQEIPRLLWKPTFHYNSRNTLYCAWPWRICTAVQTSHGITSLWVRRNLILFFHHLSKRSLLNTDYYSKYMSYEAGTPLEQLRQGRL